MALVIFRFALDILELLLRRGVKPFVVFDGFPLPAKLNEQEERKR